jgi:uncharacterized membrane protein
MTITRTPSPLTTATPVPAVIDRVVAGLTITSAVGAGLMAGLLFAFSTSVMPALRTQPAASAIATMQSANVTILNPLFLLLFVGTTASCVLLAGTAPFAHTGGSLLRVVGAVLYVVGFVVVTAAVNVPMNNALAALDASSPSTAVYWVTYLHRWTLWNDIRSIASVMACIALTVAASR